MLQITSKNRPDLLEETLKLEIKALEQRLAEKDELISILKHYNEKFLEQAERLTNILEAQQPQGTKKRDDFLLRKAAKIISNFESRTNYEDEVIEKAANTLPPINSLGSFGPNSIPSTKTTNEIDFYRDVDSVETSAKSVNETELYSNNHPFQKTIDLIRKSDQKVPETNEPTVGENSILNESRGDQLDECINNSLNANTPPHEKTLADSKPIFFAKLKPS